ncbi:hypothetical protein [Mammaliicoccus stepanovicii]|uniref:Uncharacterized protein n=1 Tax=Mammaliicoccus stepanovicii TaxID=643214 RepID=A0A240A6S9_9STAP|nr:hypothetical protein [Mammaliicoccus stepanovicii]PNZ78036.1 hypothetical protein CD111_02540 [Mammaliicoccus stepanovicii]GGI39597.1 hypothetical protein GCM10010896_04180 [Mammaliicoccus stepanovicii]SNV78880.1 Uncharacterised protein [Mammaliicoccus stepanovicii]
MVNEPLISMTILFSLIVLGEIISSLTKARVPMLLTSMVSYLLLSWAGILPDKILDNAILPSLGALVIAPVIMHMGTMMPLYILKSQWKAVVISVFGIIGSTTLILLFVTLMFDFRTAASGVGPIAGGIVALLITVDKLKEIGLANLIVLPAIVQALQGVIGMPLSAILMKKYSKYYLENREHDKNVASISNKETKQKENIFNKQPFLQNNVVRLFIMFLLSSIAFIIGDLTGIHFTLISLLFGIIGLKIGLFEQKEMERNQSFTIMMVSIILIVIGSMGGIKPHDLWVHLPAILSILIIGTIGILVGGFVGAKLIGWKPTKALPVALTALFGFPGDYILCEEVSRSVTDNEEDREDVFNELLSPMIIGGFTTVTVASVVLTTIIMNFI